MAELKLEWSEWPEGSPHVWRIKRASLGSGEQQLDLRATGPNVLDGSFHWDASFMGQGTAPTLLAAQLAAESAALQWLSEGVAALGGRVLDAGEVALCVEALEVAHGASSRRPTRALYMPLARKLGGEHG
jgi:hypothetical protein